VAVQDAVARSTPAVISVRETDTVARVANGETLVLGGFTRTNGGRRFELVIMLTPRILNPVGAL
jgi:type II secretory pathway component GspD/PulD (secretin)